MMAPHFNPKATKYGIVTWSEGWIQIAFLNGTSTMDDNVGVGDVFWVPRYYPVFQKRPSASPPLQEKTVPSSSQVVEKNEHLIMVSIFFAFYHFRLCPFYFHLCLISGRNYVFNIMESQSPIPWVPSKLLQGLLSFAYMILPVMCLNSQWLQISLRSLCLLYVRRLVLWIFPCIPQCFHILHDGSCRSI